MVAKLFLLIVAIIFIFNSPLAAMGKNNITSTPVPDFTLPNLADENISLSTFLGKKVILLVFGTSECYFCLKEIPELKEIYGKFKDRDFILLFIDIGESKKKVEAMVRKNSISYPVLLDEKGEAAFAYKVYGPTVFLIDRQGAVIFTGGLPQPHGFLARKIEELLLLK